jgi:hypothetical protein
MKRIPRQRAAVKDATAISGLPARGRAFAALPAGYRLTAG